MKARHRRLTVAGVAAAAAIAVPAAALASGSSSPPSKPAAPPSAAAKPAAPADKPSHLSALATSAGISVSKLQTGLIAAKRAGGNGSAAVAAFARSTGLSNTTAKRIIDEVFGKSVDHGTSDQAMANALATRLGVSTSAAQRAVQQLSALTGNRGVDPSSAGFAAVARGLGVSPNKLAAGLDAAKRSLSGR